MHGYGVKSINAGVWFVYDNEYCTHVCVYVYVCMCMCVCVCVCGRFTCIIPIHAGARVLSVSRPLEHGAQAHPRLWLGKRIIPMG